MKRTETLLVLYDGQCPICCRKVDFLERRNQRNRLSFADIRAADFRSPDLNIDFQALEKRIHAVKGDGSVVSGMEAVRAAWQGIGRGWLAGGTDRLAAFQTAIRPVLRLGGRKQAENQPVSPLIVTPSPLMHNILCPVHKAPTICALTCFLLNSKIIQF